MSVAFNLELIFKYIFCIKVQCKKGIKMCIYFVFEKENNLLMLWNWDRKHLPIKCICQTSLIISTIFFRVSECVNSFCISLITHHGEAVCMDSQTLIERMNRSRNPEEDYANYDISRQSLNNFKHFPYLKQIKRNF